jgi:hypothetical protein
MNTARPRREGGECKQHNVVGTAVHGLGRLFGSRQAVAPRSLTGKPLEVEPEGVVKVEGAAVGELGLTGQRVPAFKLTDTPPRAGVSMHGELLGNLPEGPLASVSQPPQELSLRVGQLPLRTWHASNLLQIESLYIVQPLCKDFYTSGIGKPRHAV